ncbi:uncharacterized protein BCR38DRAFT_458248 [Pseudomassariella vexata]|uniref:FAD-binding domain-containing protein n=1 Tax=Pseudomassariella vexata TaxID=1141098 RepID=A0A1Y2DUP7_9PEZI|nr:uncharacterized protein BCR38DRAFT_458248 [Pseudomassariella vexata]ORY62993.1 hypothetical protein BCR38DRAFT_458248 [Pseudomassariella vexata]
MPDRKLKIAIAGGGIAGLALAAGLIKKQHLEVRVYESVAAYKDIGAGLALHMNAIKAMMLLGPEVRQAYLDKALTMVEDEEKEMVTEVVLAQGPHKGQLVAELGRAKGRKTVSRADLLEGVLGLLPEGTVEFGKKVKEIEERSDGNDDGGYAVHVTFVDCTEVEADVLIGADGIHSPTRSYLLGADHPATEPKNHDGWQIYRTMVPVKEAVKHINPKWTTTVPILLGPRGHVNCIPLNKNTRLSAGVAVRGKQFLTDGKLDPEWYSDYSEDAQQIVRLVAKDTSASWKAADHDHAPFYSKGQVCIMGDAAHASLPFAGNGAAQALEDAAVLDALFAHVTKPGQIEMALKAYDEVRRPRSQMVVEIARRFGRVYAYAEEEGRMHEDPEKMRKFFGEMGKVTNEFDVKGQNARAVRMFVELSRKGEGIDE